MNCSHIFRKLLSSSAIFAVLLSFLLGLISAGLITFPAPQLVSGQEIDVYNTSDTWVVPDGVVEVTVEAWGGGGGGVDGNAGGGGGGGAYTKGTVSVTPGETYNINVAASVSGDTNGNSSSFTGDNSLQITASGGLTGDGSAGGDGGSAASTAPSHIEASFAGGAGGTGVSGGPAGSRVGGGGGGSATDSAAGDSGDDGSAGGGGGSGEGAGGNGTSSDGGNGNQPGGGGGGGRNSGGDGAAGRITLTYEAVDLPTRFVFVTPERTITAGECSGSANAITIETQDDSDTAVAPPEEITVRITSNSPSYALYSDNSCNNELVNGDITFTESDDSQTFYIVDERKSSPSWTLSAEQQSGPGDLDSDTQMIFTEAADVSRLVVTLPGQSFTDGEGVSGSADPQTAGTSFNISSISATDDFYNVNEDYDGMRSMTYTGPANAPDETSPSYTTSVNFDNGESTTTLNTTLFNSETTAITATEAGQFGYPSSTLTINSGLLDNFLVELETPIIAGGCSNDNTVIARDQWLNERNNDTSTVNMTNSGDDVVFYTNDSCDSTTTQYTLDSGSTDFFLRSEKKQESLTVTATKSGDVQDGTSNDGAIHPAEVVSLLPILPGQTFDDGNGVTGSPSFSGLRSPHATAGLTFDIDLKAVDEFNNLADVGINLYSGTKSLDYSSSVAGEAPDNTNPDFPSSDVSFTDGVANGLSFTFYNAASDRAIQADDTSTPITGTSSTTFSVQSNIEESYIVEPDDTTQTAGAAFDVTITAIDNWGNQLGSLYSAPSGTYTWETNASNAPDSTPPSIGTLAQSDFNNGIAIKNVNLYRAETSVTFTANEPSSGIGGVSENISVTPGYVSSDTESSTVNGNATVNINQALLITITLRDAWQNPIENIAPGNIIVNGTTSPSITQPSTATDSAGQTTAELTWSNAGEQEVSVEIQSIPLVLGDGTTNDPSGLLADTHSVEVVLPSGSVRIQGGATIRGGTTLQ